MAAKTTSPNGVIDFAALVPSQRRYEWFAMDQEDGDDGEPFKVKAQRLTPAEVEAIPVGDAKIVDVLTEYRRYLVGWNLTAQTDAGDVVPVPPPAELEPESVAIVLDRLLTQEQAAWLYQVIKAGHVLKMLAQKKALIRSATLPAPSPEDSSAAE